MNGVRHRFSEERNFRLRTAAAGYVLISAPHVLSSTVEWAVLLLTVVSVMGASFTVALRVVFRKRKT